MSEHTDWCIRNVNCTAPRPDHAVDCPARLRPYTAPVSAHEGSEQ